MLTLLITVGVVVGVNVSIEVVADLAVSRKHAVQHLLAIDQQSQCLTNIVVVKWLDVDSHTKCQPCSCRVFNDIQIFLRGERLVLLKRNVNRNIDLLGDQCVHQCGLVCEVDDSNFIEVDILCIPISVKAFVHALTTRGVTHKAESTRADLCLAVVANLCNRIGISRK